MSEEQRQYRKRLQNIRITRTETKPMNLRIFNCNNVKRAAQNVDEILKHVLTKGLTEARDLIRSVSISVGELVRKKERKLDGLKTIF